METNLTARERMRNFFCVVAILALFFFAIMTAFPYGPPSPGSGDEQTTNPAYSRMSRPESAWRLCLGALLVGAAFAVMFTLLALRDEKKQVLSLHEEMRQLLAEKRSPPHE
jgi:hypothetical protein